jgi:hypothetical protein
VEKSGGNLEKGKQGGKRYTYVGREKKKRNELGLTVVCRIGGIICT